MNITNDKVTKYIQGFYNPINQELKELRDDAETQRVPVILRETEIYLVNMLRILKPKRILEIGSAVGYSAMVFSNTLPDAHIVTIEKDELAYIKAEENLSNYPNVKVYKGDAKEVIESLNGKFDLVFIDAAKSHYKMFFELAEKKCEKDAVIISDNVLLRASTADDSFDEGRRHKTNIRKMREFLNYLNERKDLSTAVISCGDGIAVTKLNEK